MAAYIGHVLSTVGSKNLLNSTKISTVWLDKRNRHGKAPIGKKKIKLNEKDHIRKYTFEARAESLQSRGFLRNLPTYAPPENVGEKLEEISEQVIGTSNPDHTFSADEKFKLLTTLNKEFSHIVPSSILHRMKTLGNVYEFYMQEKSDITPYDRLQEMELPPNLHILANYHRFHPDTDTMFGGVSAFPKSSTFVPGLKTRKKYKGYQATEMPWYDV